MIWYIIYIKSKMWEFTLREMIFLHPGNYVNILVFVSSYKVLFMNTKIKNSWYK